MAGRIPTHRCTTYLPGVGEVVSEVRPTGRAKVRGYCKYCRTTHRDWWHMPKEEYPGDEPVLLCGRCEHASQRSSLG